MSSLSLLSVYLSGASLILLLTAVSQAQYHVFTPTPDYDGDYNATFDYSFFSNTSSEDLEKFSERFFDPEEDTGGRQEEEETTMAVTTATTTEKGRDNVHRNAASLPVPQEIGTLLWTLAVLMSLNTQLLPHTL